MAGTGSLWTRAPACGRLRSAASHQSLEGRSSTAASEMRVTRRRASFKLGRTESPTGGGHTTPPWRLRRPPHRGTTTGRTNRKGLLQSDLVRASRSNEISVHDCARARRLECKNVANTACLTSRCQSLEFSECVSPSNTSEDGPPLQLAFAGFDGHLRRLAPRKYWCLRARRKHIGANSGDVSFLSLAQRDAGPAMPRVPETAKLRPFSLGLLSIGWKGSSPGNALRAFDFFVSSSTPIPLRASITLGSHPCSSATPA